MFLITLCVVLILVAALKPAPQAPKPVGERVQLLGKKELAFYKELRGLADAGKLLVFAKVRMSEIVRVERENESYAGWVTKSKNACADFILCEPSGFRTVLVLQLDDQHRDRPHGPQWNADILELCRASGIPALVIEDRSVGALEKTVRQKLGGQAKQAAPATATAPIQV